MEHRSRRARLHLVASAEEPRRDDAELVSALFRGESEAARAIWTRHAPMVHRLLERALGPNAEAEDITQDVFLSTFSRLGSLRDASALRSFIYSIAIRTLRWELRRRRVRRVLRLSPTGEPPEVPVRAADSEARQILARFYRLLDELSANERTVFVLRHMEGFKLEEISEQTGVSLATVKRWLSRAGRKISDLVDADSGLSSYVREQGIELGGFHARG